MRVYADNAATTKLSPAAKEAMLPYFDEIYGNPSTLYTLGQEAAEHLLACRTEIAQLIGAADPREIVFTSGGSEADNPRKLEECGTRLVTLPEYDMPLLEGCAAWIVFRVVPELHNQKAYDLFIGEAVAAFADDRVFVNGRWNFEEAPDDLRTLHYVAGGHFYTIGDALEVPASA